MRHHFLNRNLTLGNKFDCRRIQITVAENGINLRLHGTDTSNIQLNLRISTHSNQSNCSASCNQFPRLKRGKFRTGSLIYLIHTAHCLKQCNHILLFAINSPHGAQFFCLLQPLVQHINCIDLINACSFQRHNRHKTDTAAAQHNRALSHFCFRNIHCMKSHCQWLHKTAFHGIHIIRKLKA